MPSPTMLLVICLLIITTMFPRFGTALFAMILFMLAYQQLLTLA